MRSDAQKTDPAVQAEKLRAQLADCEASTTALQAQMTQAIRDEDFALAGELKPRVQAEAERQAQLQKELDAVLAKMPPVRAACAGAEVGELGADSIVMAVAMIVTAAVPRRCTNRKRKE